MKSRLKKSVLSKVAFIALLAVAGINAGCSTENETAITNFGKFVYTVERTIADFFNSSIKTPYVTFVASFENILLDCKRSFEPTTRAVGDELTKGIYDVVDYAIQQFTIPFSIIKKYNGKPAAEALAFSAEIRRNFSTEKVFGELISKLKTLKCKAEKADEKDLAKKIDTIITMVEKKRKEWNAKSDPVLFAGLQIRMNAK